MCCMRRLLNYDIDRHRMSQTPAGSGCGIVFCWRAVSIPHFVSVLVAQWILHCLPRSVLPRSVPFVLLCVCAPLGQSCTRVAPYTFPIIAYHAFSRFTHAVPHDSPASAYHAFSRFNAPHYSCLSRPQSVWHDPLCTAGARLQPGWTSRLEQRCCGTAALHSAPIPKVRSHGHARVWDVRT